MRKKIFLIFVSIVLLSNIATGSLIFSKEQNSFSGPPKDHKFKCPSYRVNDWRGMDVLVDGHSGRVTSVQDSNNDGNVSYCDYVVIKWRDQGLTQPYYKYHCKGFKYISDPTDPYYGYFEFDLDYKSNSRLCPKLAGCCHYVDDDNIAGPWYGTEQNPWKTITQGLESGLLVDGDNIYVLGGNYEEYDLELDIPISLIGRPDFKGGTIVMPLIDGQNNYRICNVTSANVAISGFILKSCCSGESAAAIDIKSNSNLILGNTVEENTNGIYLHQSANDNKISENTVKNNDFGIFIHESSDNNMLYENNLITSIYFHAKDKCTNNWDDGEYGNYWDDYTGSDLDDDGIGDTPYSILGEGSNEDNYPLMDQYTNNPPDSISLDGPSKVKAGEECSFLTIVSDPEYHDYYICYDWDDGSDYEYKGPFGSGEEVITNKTWEEKGDYKIRVRAIDMFGEESSWTTMDVSVPINVNPNLDLVIMILTKIIEYFPALEPIIGPIIENLLNG